MKYILFYKTFIIKEHFHIFREMVKKNIENGEMSFIFSNNSRL